MWCDLIQSNLATSSIPTYRTFSEKAGAWLTCDSELGLAGAGWRLPQWLHRLPPALRPDGRARLARCAAPAYP